MQIFLSFILFGLTAFGLSWIISKSKLFRPIREVFNLPYVYRTDSALFYLKEVFDFLYSLLTCIVCTSVWVGIGLSLLIEYTFLSYLGFPTPIMIIDTLLYGVFSATVTILLGTFTGDMD